ncbi:MAG: hypothetical protein ABIO74_00005, partial [Dokdonella sp.]
DNADLMLWDLQAGKVVENRHVPGVYPIGVAALGDKPLLAGREGLVLDPGAPDEHSVTGLRDGESTTVFAFSHDDRLIAHAFGTHVQLYDATNLTPIGPPLQSEGSQMHTIVALAFSDDDRHLLAYVSPSVASRWRLWPVATSRSSMDQLRAEAALLTPRSEGARVLRMADANERARLRAADPGPQPVPIPPPMHAVAGWVGRDPIPSRDPGASPLQIDLGPVYNHAPATLINVMNSSVAAMDDIPFGLVHIGGIVYDWRGALEMQRNNENDAAGSRYQLAMRGGIRGLHAPSQPIAALHVLLYAPEPIGESRERVYAVVRLHYRDGSEATLPIRTQREVSGWTEHDRPTPIGWIQGTAFFAIGTLQTVQYNNPRLPNPHPEKIVETLDLETAPSGWSTPVFFAITAEPVIATVNSPMPVEGTGNRAHARDGTPP